MAVFLFSFLFILYFSFLYSFFRKYFIHSSLFIYTIHYVQFLDHGFVRPSVSPYTRLLVLSVFKVSLSSTDFNFIFRYFNKRDRRKMLSCWQLERVYDSGYLCFWQTSSRLLKIFLFVYWWMTNWQTILLQTILYLNIL